MGERVGLLTVWGGEEGRKLEGEEGRWTGSGQLRGWTGRDRAEGRSGMAEVGGVLLRVWVRGDVSSCSTPMTPSERWFLWQPLLRLPCPVFALSKSLLNVFIIKSNYFTWFHWLDDVFIIPCKWAFWFYAIFPLLTALSCGSLKPFTHLTTASTG